MQDFTNDILDVDSFPKYEEVPLNPISKKYWNIVLINIMIFLFILTVGLASALIILTELRPYIYLIFAGYLVFCMLLIFLYKADIDRRGFALREKDILYKSGILSISTTLIPFSRIQHITLDEGVLSRMYQLGQLRIYTAGGSSGSLNIPGIDIEQAQQIKELLMTQINQDQ